MSLATITPLKLADEVAERVLVFVTLHLGLCLSPYQLHLLPSQTGEHPGLETDIGLTVAQLVRWTKIGALGDWTDHNDAADALQNLLKWTKDGAMSDPEQIAVLNDQGEPKTDLDTLLLAAWCRVQLERGETVTPRQLGALGDCTAHHVRYLIRQADLPQQLRLSDPQLRAWLVARGRY